MKSVSEYICELLYRHDCVIVPGLGGIVCNHTPARFDRKRSLLLPPRKDLVFNMNLSHNDGVLISHLAQAENIGFAEAAARVDDYVAQARRAIQKRMPFMISGVGTLRTHDGVNISFVPDDTCNYLSESYGLGSLHIGATTRLQLPSIGQVGMRRVAISAAVVAGLLMVSQETKVGVPDMPIFSQAGYTRMMAAREAQQPSADVRPQVEPAPPAQAQEAASAEQPAAADAPRYDIIAASFVTEAEADEYIRSMASRGVNGMVKLVSARRVRVSIASFDDREEANRRMRQCRKMQGFETVWVFRH